MLIFLAHHRKIPEGVFLQLQRRAEGRGADRRSVPSNAGLDLAGGIAATRR